MHLWYAVGMAFTFLNRFKKILIVEDDPALLKALVIKCQHKGFQTITANSGRDVLAIVAEQKPAGILLDLMLPTQDGMAILHRLRGNEVQYTRPVVILTNLRGSSDLRAEAEGLHAQYFDKAGTPIDTAVEALVQKL